MNQEQKNIYVRLRKQCAEKGKYKELEKNQLFQDLQNCLKDYEKLTCEETDIIYSTFPANILKQSLNK